MGKKVRHETSPRGGSNVNPCGSAVSPWRVLSRSGKTIRESGEIWSRVSVLITALERCVASATRLDYYRRRDAAEDAVVEDLFARLDALGVRVDRELDRLTCERLAVDLAYKELDRLLRPTGLDDPADEKQEVA